MARNLGAAINTFFGRGVEGKYGGLQIQFNIVSKETLEEAIRKPEAHYDLLVRVSGYSAFFIDLNPEMQKEILERTEYIVSSGYAQNCASVEICQKLKH
jgi:formate C-acetyltransferase